MFRRRLTGVLVILLLSFSCAFSRDAGRPAVAKNTWTVDDIVLADTATDFQLSPDGRWAVWVKSSVNEEKNKRVSQLMRTNLRDGEEVELTRGPEGAQGPRWSPDAKLLAFLSERAIPKNKNARGHKGKGREDAEEEPKSQLWLINPSGGEPWHLTELSRAVVAFDWAGSDKLLFLAAEDPTYQDNVKKEEKKDTTQVVEDEQHITPVRLFQIAVKSKKVTRVSDNTDRIEALYASPDGKHAITIHNRSPRFLYDNRIKPVVYLYDVESGSRKHIFEDKKLTISSVPWRADSQGFYATQEVCTQPEYVQAGVTELVSYDLASGKYVPVPLDWERGLSPQADNANAGGLVLLPDGFLALLADGASNRLARYRRKNDTWEREWVKGEHAGRVQGFQTAAHGQTLVYAHSRANLPTQWYRVTLKGNALEEPKAIARLNEDFAERPKARTEICRWQGGLDEQVEGILYYPLDYQEGKKYPLVVMIHGGPAGVDLDSWDESWAYAPHLLCQRGAFVLRPNYHGSTNYGLKWMESITRGKYCEPEMVDIEKGVDALIARGLVEADRLALAGWSNGAILTNQLTVRSTRWKAAVAGAGNVEYVSDWANCEFGDAFNRYYLGKTPLDDPQLYFRKSPFFKLDRVRTPTLIFFGSEDRVVPTEQGWVHYRGLQQVGKTPVRFILFPGEKHSLTNPAHQRRKLEEELAWLDRHLFGTVKEENSALKADSPLAWALQRQSASKDKEGRLGVMEGGKLIPEIVEYQGLRVARFEVTRSQYGEFMEQNPAPPRELANYPASGVPFASAQEYCARLSKLTGRQLRLPNEDEAEILYRESKDEENTLDYWAGYKVNPDDAARLRDKIKQLAGLVPPLLRPVGSFRGVGSPRQLFDLGGNVAEWTVGPDGKGVLRGGSADSPADARRKGSTSAPEYRGFRVIEEKPVKKQD